MFKTREEIDAEFERIWKDRPELNGVRAALVQALENNFTKSLKLTTTAAIVLGFKETIYLQGLVLLDLYFYSVQEAAKFDEKEKVRSETL